MNEDEVTPKLGGPAQPFTEPRKLRRSDLVLMRLPECFWKAGVELVTKPHLRKFLEDLPRHVRSGYSLLLLGETGSGKSTFAALLAKRATAWRFHTLWLSAWEFRKSQRENIEYEGQSALTLAQSMDVFVLDDVTADDLSDPIYGASDLTSFIKARAEAQRMTVVTLPRKHAFSEHLALSVPNLIQYEIEGGNLREKANDKLESAFTGGKL